MRVLVTGYRGFIGRNLVDSLKKQGHDVFLTSGIDITHYLPLHHIVQDAQPDVCYHLAAYGNSPLHTNISNIYKTNIDGTRNLIMALNHTRCKLMVNASTSSVYGFKYAPMEEHEFLEPNSHYAISKATAEYICNYEANDKLAICNLRLFSVYGPHEKEYRFIPTIIRQALSNQEIKLADPLIARDFIYVDDVIDYIQKIQPIHNKKTFNIGWGAQVTLREVINKVLLLTNSTSKVTIGTYPKRSWDTKSWVANNNLMLHEFGIPKINLEDGLRKTIQWVKDNDNH